MKLSIITINYNNSDGLERTINSVVNQTYRDFEYIIIDGNSSDKSVDVIRKYSDKIDYWISEPDLGIYNAMNKGISKAHGEYVLFINSGDSLKETKSIEKSKFYLYRQDIIYCNLCVIYDSFCEIKTYPGKLSMKYFLRETLPHPASFIKRNLFNKYGNYNESYKIVSDWAFFFKIIVLKRCSYFHLDTTISLFIFDGMSSNPLNKCTILREKEDFYYKNLSVLRRLYKRLLRLYKSNY